MFGGVLADFQPTQSKLAQMATMIDSAALLIYRAAWMRDQGRNVTREAAMAKLTATENAQQVIDMAVQMWGGLGVVSEQPVERRRWPSPSGSAACCCSRWRSAPPPCCWKKSRPRKLLDGICEFGATVLFTAPISYRTLAQHGDAIRAGTLRRCVSAGEALPAATRALWKQATGIELIDGIGATEMLHIFISADESAARPGATGVPVPGYSARVVDAHGHPVPPNTVGRLAVQGPTGCRYLEDARQAQYVKGGWNLTGDAYSMDDDGYFHYQSRTGDMIISAGYNVASPEVEEALPQHPAVAECGVIGVPDEERGQIVKAFVVLRPGQEPGPATVRTLQDFVKQTVAPYKYPCAVEFVAALPRTETGKLQRFRLGRSDAPAVP